MLLEAGWYQQPAWNPSWRGCGSDAKHSLDPIAFGQPQFVYVGSSQYGPIGRVTMRVLASEPT